VAKPFLEIYRNLGCPNAIISFGGCKEIFFAQNTAATTWILPLNSRFSLEPKLKAHTSSRLRSALAFSPEIYFGANLFEAKGIFLNAACLMMLASYTC